MSKIIAIIIIILLIIGGYFLFFRDNTPESATQNNQETPTNTNSTNTATQNNITVTYTDGGFSPKTITVKNGGTVTFLNQSSEDMWVASAPHPAHTIYPTFDQKDDVLNGGSWSFTFDRVGTWNYHNHRSSSDTGTIVVQ